MKLCTTTDGVGRVEGDEVVLLDAAHRDVGALLSAGDLQNAERMSARARLPFDEAQLLAPVPRPGKVWIVGLNYAAHAAETGLPRPARPLVYLTPGSAVVGPGQPIVLPRVAPGSVDYEGEVAVVIGRTATDVAEPDAWSFVAGVTACNDVSARDIQRHAMKQGSGVDIALAKSLDTFKPMGPLLVTVDEFDDPDDIGLTTHVNAELRQSARTSDLIFAVPELVSFVSRYTTLDAGDVISTGSPAGVGFAEGIFLAHGDTVIVTVDGVGSLQSPVITRHVES